MDFRRSRSATVALSAATVGCLLYIGSTSLLDPTEGGEWFWEFWLFNTIVLVAGLTALARGLTNQATRIPALCISASILFWGAGNVAWWLLVRTAENAPYPSIADIGYLLFYPPAIAGVLAAGSKRAEWRNPVVLLDGLIAGLAVTSIGAVVFIDPIARATTGTRAAIITNMAYPILDLLLLALALTSAGLSGWHLRTDQWIILASLCIWAVADSGYLLRVANGTDNLPTVLDTGWIVAIVGLAWSQQISVGVRDPKRPVHGRAVWVPVAFVGIALGAFAPLVVSQVSVVGALALGAALVCAGVRMVATLKQLERLAGVERELEARRGSERLSALILHSSDAILLVDPDAVIQFASPSVQTLFGRDTESALGTCFADWLSEEDRVGLFRQLADVTNSPGQTLVPLEGRGVSRSGLQLRLEGTACNLLGDDNVNAIVLTVRDVTTRRALEEQLERKAFHDDLTGLANRALFLDRVEHALQRVTSHTGSVAVLFIDLDDFKAINDGMGHGAGDELLREVADRIRTAIRPADTVARLGGDEFAVLVEDVSSAGQVLNLSERILQTIREPVEVQGRDIIVSASIGVASATADTDVESLLRDADIAMYCAKSNGKSRVDVFDDSLREVAQQRLSLKIELPSALRDSQFRVVYQPIHRIQDGNLSGFEALVRWDHPQRGEVGPDEFIPAAEESGVIVELGLWVLEQACRQAVFWNKSSAWPVTMSVNVSGVQLRRPSFVDELKLVLGTTGLSPNLLTVELTESVLIEHESVEPLLRQIRALGVGIAIDDFGTGYSSLSYLKRFPVSIIKIDRSFIKELTLLGDHSLVRSIVAIASALSLQTVAEGVETQDQLDALESLDCQLAQGFFLGRPMNAIAADFIVEAMTTTSRIAAAQP